jgi:hypothetical protein
VSSLAWVWELGRERGGSVFIQTQDWVFNVLPLDKESGCNFQRAKVVCTKSVSVFFFYALEGRLFI